LRDSQLAWKDATWKLTYLTARGSLVSPAIAPVSYQLSQTYLGNKPANTSYAHGMGYSKEIEVGIKHHQVRHPCDTLKDETSALYKSSNLEDVPSEMGISMYELRVCYPN
jgi:hypothetical protein